MIETTGYISSKSGEFRAVCLDCKIDNARIKTFRSADARNKWIRGHSNLHGHREFTIETGKDSWEIRNI